MEELVSIIMPAHNAEAYIAQAIESVLAQTWKCWELIIVDDASSDHSYEIAEAYAQKYTQIRVLKNKENQGTAGTRKKGIRQARGSWIAFLDSDDCWESVKLERQLAAAGRYTADFVFTGSSFMDERGNPLEGQLFVPEQVGYRQLLKQNIISCSSVLIKKKLLIRYPMEEGAFHEDFLLWLRILRGTGIIAAGINEPLLRYRINPSSKSGDKKKSALMTYRVYRVLGLGRVQAGYYWCWYAWRSWKKYRRILQRGSPV